MKIKKIILSIVAILIVVAVVFAMVRGSKNRNGASGKLKVVVSNYASYDFLRAIIGDNENIELTFLMGPGKNAHSYDPTAQDLVKIQEADLFVYVGGEMEQWSEKVLDSLERDNQEVICIADFVDTIEEKEVDGAEEEEHHHEEDEEHEHNDEDEEEE